jgi:hypothetical protein
MATGFLEHRHAKNQRLERAPVTAISIVSKMPSGGSRAPTFSDDLTLVFRLKVVLFGE